MSKLSDTLLWDDRKQFLVRGIEGLHLRDHKAVDDTNIIIVNLFIYITITIVLSFKLFIIQSIS